MSEIDNSGIEPRGTLVLVKMNLLEQKTASGIIKCSVEELERKQMGQVKGILVAVGEDAYHDFKNAPKVGDHVFVKKYSGVHIETNDGHAYRMCQDLEAPAVLRNPDQIKETI
jgi:co-chaperonin GroES (HSP10)